MKALVLEQAGSLDDLTVQEGVEKPGIQADEIRVKVYAAGLNPSDYQTALYQGNGLPDVKRRILGLDVSGIVDEVGSEVREFSVGDRVYYLRGIANPNGGFAEYATTTARTASKLPEGISFEQAASVPGAGFTAYQIMAQKFRAEPGKSILIHGGAGGVGGYAIQLAKLRGLTVYTTCLEKDFAYVKNLGADVAIDYQTEDVYGTLERMTEGWGIDYVLNTIGPESATRDLEILTFGGELAVTAGFPDFGRLNFYEKGLSLHEIALGASHTAGDLRAELNLAKIGDDMAQLMVEHRIAGPQVTAIKLEDIPTYLQKMRDGKITGKVIAKIADLEE